MKTIIVACKTLEDELNFAMAKMSITFPVFWIESGLHNTPKKLNSRLKEQIHSIEANRILVAIGFCGNSIQGISSKVAELIVPRVDDCLSLLIGSAAKRAQISREHAAYFLTEGWLRGERNLWVEYQYTVDKYGTEEAKNIAKMMYGHYRTLGLLDAGVKPVEPLLSDTQVIADTLGLKQQVIPASVSYLEQLLTGPWPQERFIVKAAGAEICYQDLCLP